MTKKILSEEVKHNITKLVDRKFIRHILCEYLGVNKWYCKNGVACKK